MGLSQKGNRRGVSALLKPVAVKEEPCGRGLGKGSLGVVKDGPMVGVSVKPKSGVAKDVLKS